MKAILGPAGFAAVLVLATASSAQTPQRTTATYGQWTVRCELSGEDAASRACEMFQVVTVQGQSAPVAQVAFARQAEEGYRLIVQSPLNVWLPAGVTFSAEDAEIATAQFKRCFPRFCLAEADVTEAALEGLRDSGEGAVVFQDSAQREVSVPISFAGLADAYTALAAETAENAE